jgi:iron complex transport system substrate-binding protein
VRIARIPVTRLIILLSMAVSIFAARAEVRVVDDSGQEVVLKSPARRIVSLAPHATETLFDAAAGHLIVGTVKYADHPEAARKIPRVGDSAMLDLERIVSLQPDLIVVWLHGNSEKHLQKVRKLGIPMFYSRPNKLSEIPSSLTRLGQLAGTEPQARKAAEAFAARLEELEKRYAHSSTVPLFFQVWQKPLLTINGTQIISDVIRLCGGRNIFAGEKLLVPTVEVEAVVSANPEAVVRTGKAADPESAFELWRNLPDFRPTATRNLVLLETDALGRPSPRILDGAAMMCEQLESVRARRPS